MTQVKTKIPAEMEPAAVGGMVTDAKYVIDREQNKTQTQINTETGERITAEVDRAEQAEYTLDGKIAAEKTRAEGVEGGLNTRLQTVEQLAEISVGGGDIGIGTAADFESNDPSDLAKVPTISAMFSGVNDGVYDISARHSGTKYADLVAALGTNGANVPVGVRKGGMSIKFVLASNNKYKHYKLLVQNFTTNVFDWEEYNDVITSNQLISDLDISDEQGNVLARFKNGGIKTKNFDSSKDATEAERGLMSANDKIKLNSIEDGAEVNNVETNDSQVGSADLDISDEQGNVLAIFKDGHIQTKYFNSKDIQIKTQWYGKKVSIIGDSISTALSSNAVEFTVLDSDIANNRTLQGYPTYYDIGTTIGTKTVDLSMVGVLTSFSPISGDAGKTIGKPLNYNTGGSSGVASYTNTWWYKLASKLGMKVLQNVSWSGASISSHEGNTDIYKTSYAWHQAQINKLATRDSDGNTIIPDVVIIYRGTNDMTHSPYTRISDFGADATSIPNTDFADSSYDFKVAYCLTIKKIREAYPQTKIILCTLNVFKRINYSQFPTNNGINTLPEYNNAIRDVANMMGCGLIEFDKDGITFENCYPIYISDSSTIPTHPNPIGHTAMAEKAKIDIIKF